MYQTGLPLAPNGPATCTRWACHWYPVGLPFAPKGRPISEFSGYGLAASRQRVQGRTAEILKIFRNPRQLQNIWQSGRRSIAAPTAFRGCKVGRGVPPSRRQGTRIPAAWKAAFPVSAYARSLNWENGRLARSMEGPCAAPATDETSVVPVSPPPALRTGMQMRITSDAF